MLKWGLECLSGISSFEKEERKTRFAKDKSNCNRDLAKLQLTWVGSQIYIAIEVFHIRLTRPRPLPLPCSVIASWNSTGMGWPPASRLSETKADPKVAGIWTLSADQITHSWVASPNLLNVRYNPIKTCETILYKWTYRMSRNDHCIHHYEGVYLPMSLLIGKNQITTQLPRWLLLQISFQELEKVWIKEILVNGWWDL